VPPSDPQALAEALKLALSLTESERRRLSARAVAHVRANYTKELMCRRTLAVYDEILQERAAGR
jgi:glycosyltransferase involved in cell wall biosynthesis